MLEFFKDLKCTKTAVFFTTTNNNISSIHLLLSIPNLVKTEAVTHEILAPVSINALMGFP